MEIYVLVDNEAKGGYLSEHGLSLYIKNNHQNILFDTGQSDVFIKNAKSFGLDISDVDVLVISHGHYDHGGGIKKFLKENKKAKVYINRNAFGKFFNALDKYIGIENINDSRIVLTDDYYEIGDIRLFTLNNFIDSSMINPYGLTKMKDNKKVFDDFRHEQFMKIGQTLFSGCSHKGILNIINNCFDVKNVIGGFHLNKEENKRVLAIAKKMQEYDIYYHTCHCTGVNSYAILQSVLEERIKYIKAGEHIIIK